MTRQATICLLAVSLSGCATIRSWFAQEPKVDPVVSVVTLGTSLDKNEGKVAAAITVARNNADKPAVVRAETGVALSFLQPPSADDLQVASARVALSDAKTYTLAEADGRRLAAAVGLQRKQLEADQKKAVLDAQAKDKEIADLKSQLAEAETNANRTPLRVSAGLCFIAALGLTMAGQYLRAGLSVALGGILLGLSTILSSPVFIWSLIASALAVLGMGVWVAWDKARDAVNAPTPTPHDETK